MGFQTGKSEFEYIRQAFLTTAQNIPYLIRPLAGGGEYLVSLPSVRTGIGWMNYGYIRFYINDTNAISFNCRSLYSKIDLAIITTNHTIYGVDTIVVNDTRLLPRLREYYANGSTYLELDTCRLAVFIDKVGELGRVVYYVRIIYVDLEPIIRTNLLGGVNTLKLRIRGTPQIYRYDNVYGLLITLEHRDGTILSVDPAELGISPPITITIIRYRVAVEIG